MVHIFLTGASGSMGTTLIPHLLNANYTVSGLARSDASAAKISALGATPVKGDLTDLDAIAQAASQADIVIHMGFDHGQAFSGDFVGACNKDVAVVDAICSALTKDVGKAFYFASGTLGLDGTDEHAAMHRSEHMPRYKSTDAAFSYIPKGLRAVQLRLAPITYNSDRPHDFIGMWVGESKKAGYVAYTETGAWPTATYEEAAEIVLAALAKQDSLPNPVSLHLLAEEGVPFKDCADVLGKKLDLPVKQIEPAELQQLGFLGNLMGLARQPVKAEYTRQTVGWQPKGSSLVKQLGEYSY